MYSFVDSADVGWENILKRNCNIWHRGPSSDKCNRYERLFAKQFTLFISLYVLEKETRNLSDHIRWVCPSSIIMLHKF